MSEPVVGMLDLTDRTLHLPGTTHMVTRCGLEMDECQVGPFRVLVDRAYRRCPECTLSPMTQKRDQQ